MDQSVRIILQFVDNASRGVQVTSGIIGGAFKGLATTTGIAGNAIAGIWGATAGKVKNFMSNMVAHAKWASAFFGIVLVGSLQSVVDMAAKFERFGIAAEFMTGSAEAANKFAQSVRAVAKETMFNVDQIAEMESRLVGNTKNVDLSTGALRALADAVAATGGKYEELEGATRAWIQVNSKAKVSSEELNRQFANANIPIVRLLAESIVKDVNHPLRKYVSSVGSGGSGAVGASKKLTTAYNSATKATRYAGEEIRIAEDKLKSYEGNSKIAKTTVDSLKLSILKKKDAVAAANKTIGEYTAAQKKAGTATVATKLTVEGVMAQLQEIGDLNIPGSIGAAAITRALNEAYGGANAKLIKTFDGQMSLLGDTLKLTALAFMGLDENFRPVKGGILDLLKTALTPLLTFLNTHQEDLTNFASNFSKSMPAMMAFGAFLLGVLIPAIIGLLAPLLIAGAMWGALGFAIGLIIEQLGGFNTVLANLQGLWNTIIGFMNSTVIPVFQYLANSLMIFLKPSLDMLMPSLQQLGVALLPVIGFILALAGAILTGLVAGITAALPWIIGALTGLATFITGILNIIVGLFTLNFGLVWQGIQQTFGGIVEFIFNSLTAIAAFVTNFVLGVISFFEMLFNKLIGKSIIPDIVNGILNWFNTLLTKGLDAIGSLVSGIASKFTGLVSSAWGWGRDMVNNFINGIKSMAAEARSIANQGGIVGKLMKDAGFQHGGIVPGPIGQPVPILAHAGERVVPRSGADVGGFGGGGVTINMNGNISMDTEDRVRQLADRIIAIMGRQSELARWGLR